MNPVVADMVRFAAERDKRLLNDFIDLMLRNRSDYNEIIRIIKKRHQVFKEPAENPPVEAPSSQNAQLAILDEAPSPSVHSEVQSVDILDNAPDSTLAPAARIFTQVLGAPPARDVEILDQLLNLAGSEKIFLGWVKAFAAEGGKTPMEMLRGLHRWSKR